MGLRKSPKGGGLIWSLWHKVVAANTWHGKISHLVDVACRVCNLGEAQSYVHKFWSYANSQHAWRFAICVLDKLARSVGQQWNLPSWQQMLFA